MAGKNANQSNYITILEKVVTESKPTATGRNSGLQDAALIAMTYLTASRISELCYTIRKQDISFDTIQKTRFAVISNIPTRKRKKGGEPQPRSCPINLEEEGDIFAFVQAYIEDLKPNSILWPLTPDSALRMFRRKTPHHPHWYRHLRMTHLVQYYNLDAIGLKNYVNWSNLETSSWYLHLGWKDLASKLVQK